MKVIIIEWDSGRKEYIDYSMISLEYIIQNFGFMKDLYVVEKDPDYQQAISKGKEKISPIRMGDIFEPMDKELPPPEIRTSPSTAMEADIRYPTSRTMVDPTGEYSFIITDGECYLVCPETGELILVGKETTMRYTQ